MRIKYYGTAAAEGWPALFCKCAVCEEARRRGGKNIRTRSQATIDDRLLVDYPPDTYLHVLHYGLKLEDYDSCIVTHAHEDHLYRDDVAVRAHGFASVVRPKPFTLYGADSVIDLLNGLPAWGKDPERVAWHEIMEYQTFEVEGYQVTPLLAAHGKHDHIKCYIFDIEKDGERLLYGNDTGIFPEPTWDWISGKQYDLVSLDCTMLARKEGTNHMGIEDVLEVQRRLIDMGAAKEHTVWVITHFSHNGGVLHEELEEIMRPHNFHVAYDGFEIATAGR
ncbi:MAG: hypothetical protein IJ074_11275 [Clostridia bacterium]|nr:hypothetical protein [Clostridia bacterium]